MNMILRASAVLVVILAAGAAALAQGASPSGDATRGKQLFTTIGCSYCHGTVGQGGGGRAGGLRLANMGIAYPAFLLGHDPTRRTSPSSTWSTTRSRSSIRERYHTPVSVTPNVRGSVTKPDIVLGTVPIAG